ncbi:MAG: hypothetical protein C0513_06155 [Isosphaera sp.]|nr:hypothetical protein [Isosphaera sp.]
MAAKGKGSVNTKFVAILVAGMLVVGAAVVAAAVFVLQKGPEQHEADGDRFAAEGKWDEARSAYGKAVFEDLSQPRYLEKWIKALQEARPPTRERFTEMYFSDYLRAAQRLAQLRSDSAEQTGALMEELLESGRLVRSFDQLRRVVEEMRLVVPEGSPARRHLDRAWGVAVAASSATGPASETAQARALLEAAFKADPSDQEAAINLAALDSRLAESVRLTQPEESERLTAQARQYLADTVAADGANLRALSVLVTFDLTLARTKLPANTPAADVLKSLRPLAESVVTQLEAADPKLTVPIDALGLAQIAGALVAPEDLPRLERVMEAIAQARPDDVQALLSLGQFKRLAGKTDEAAEIFERVSALEDPKLSLEGLKRVFLRDVGAYSAADAAMAKRERLFDNRGSQRPAPDEIEAARKRYAGLRAALEKRVGQNDPRLLLLDGRAALVESDADQSQLTSARQKLSEYNLKTTPPNSDPDAILALSRVLLAQNLTGEAKTNLQRLIDLGRASAPVYRLLAEIDITLRDYPSALQSLEQALAAEPGNPEIIKRLGELESQVRPTEPFNVALTKIQELLQASTTDRAKVLEEGRRAIPLARTGAQQFALANLFYQMGDRQSAQRMIELAIQAQPDRADYATLRDQILGVDVLAQTVAEIDAADIPPAEKARRKYIVYTTRAENAKAEPFYQEWKRLDPEAPPVVNIEFERALAAGNFDEARRQAEIAARKNIDQAGGELVYSRLELAQGRVQDALRRAQAVTERDALNPIAWRSLAEAQVAARRGDEAVRSLQRALSIKPDDASAVNALIVALQREGRSPEALQVAREKEQITAVVSDPAFIETLLRLEYEVGDRAKAIDRRLRVFESVPGYRPNSQALAQALIREGRLTDAERVVTKLAEVAGADGPVTVLRAALAGQNGRTDEARKIVNDTILALPEAQRAGNEHAQVAAELLGFNTQALRQLAVAVLEDGRQYQRPDVMESDRTLGDVLYQSQDYLGAATSYQRVLESVKQDPDDRVRLRLAECRLQLGQLEEAARLLEGAKAEGPALLPRLLLQAQVARRRGDANAARRLMDAAITADPNNPASYFQRATILGEDPTLRRDAVADLRRAIELNPRFLLARAALSSFLERSGDTQGALTVLREGVRLDPRQAEPRVLLIRNLERLGQLDEAAVVAGQGATEATTPGGRAYWLAFVGRMRDVQQNHTASAQAWAEAFEISPEPAVGLSLINASLRREPPDLPAAKRMLARPEMQVDQLWPVLVARGEVARREGRRVDMERDARAALALAIQQITVGTKVQPEPQPQQAALFVTELARIYPEAADRVAFMDAADRAGGIPELMRVYVAAALLTDPAQASEGLSRLERLAQESQDRSTISAASVTLAQRRFEDGQLAESEKHFRRALELAPESSDLLNNLAFVLAQQDKAAEAVSLAQKAVEREQLRGQENPNYLDTLGVAQFRAGNAKQAADTLRRASLSAPFGPAQGPILLHLIQAQLASEDQPAARRTYEELERVIKGMSEEARATYERGNKDTLAQVREKLGL